MYPVYEIEESLKPISTWYYFIPRLLSPAEITYELHKLTQTNPILSTKKVLYFNLDGITFFYHDNTSMGLTGA